MTNQSQASTEQRKENYNETEAAKWLGVSRITLQRERYAGRIAFYRVGGSRVIYSRKHLEDYLAKRERAAYGYEGEN